MYRLLHVGRKAQDPLLEAAEKYIQRLSRYVKVELHRVREVGDAALEGRDLLLQLDKSGPGLTIILDERGAVFTTAALAQQLAHWQDTGSRHLTFVVGGADGLDPRVKARAQHSMCLSAFTLPHRLALVMLAEQLYRAHTILKGEPYHRP